MGVLAHSKFVPVQICRYEKGMMIKMAKIVILGAGHVGSMCALNLAQLGICEEIVLIDVVEGKADAQAKDVADATVFMNRMPIVREGNYRDCDDADIIVNAVGVSRKPGQTRLDLLDVTIDIMEEVVEKLNKTAFHGFFISISNPCDIVVNYVREHMNMPKNRIFGTGTMLDTARLRLTLHQLTGIAANSIECFAMGEHGDSSMVAMSQISFMGKPLYELQVEKPEIFGKVTQDILLERTHQLGMEIVIGKGSTEFGIGAALAQLCKTVLYDEKRIFPVSAYLDGEYGQSGLMAGVPAIIGRKGVEEIIELKLNQEEEKAFAHSCDIIRTYITKANAR